MHTAQWPDEDGLDGRRVAIVGTGASAVQLLPEVAVRAAHTTVFQRTPAWILRQARQGVEPGAPAPLPPVAGPAAGGPLAHLLGARGPGAAVRAVPRHRPARREAWPCELSRRRSPTRVTRAKLTPGLHHRLQADPAVQRLLADLRPRGRVPRDRSRSRASSPTRWSPATAPVTRSTPWCWAPVSTSPAASRASTSGVWVVSRWRRPGRAVCTRTSASPCPASRSSTSSWAPTPGLGHNSVVLMIELATGYVMQCLERGRSGAHVVTRRAQAAFTVGDAAQDGPHRVGDRVPQLVSRRVRPQHDDLARLDHRLLVADPAARPRRLRARALARSRHSADPSPGKETIDA